MEASNKPLLIIRPHVGRLVWHMLAAVFFVALGAATIILPLSVVTTTYGPYTTGPIEYAVLLLTGCGSILFGLAAIVALVVKVWQPILILDSNGIVYHRHRVDIAWPEVSHMQPVTEWNGHKVRWIYLFVTAPDQYSGQTMVKWDATLTEADWVLDLSLASSGAYRQACTIMQAILDCEDR